MNQFLNKKNIIAFIIAFQDFRDEEYFIPKGILESFGVRVETFSLQKGQALGVFGGVVEIEKTLEDFKSDDFSAAVFIGGEGALKLSEDKKCLQIAAEMAAKNKVVAAICISPLILAKAGALKGKKATVWQSDLDKSAVKILENQGAEVIDSPVVIDRNIITANGPEASRKFAEAILRGLTS